LLGLLLVFERKRCFSGTYCATAHFSYYYMIEKDNLHLQIDVVLQPTKLSHDETTLFHLKSFLKATLDILYTLDVHFGIFNDV